MDQNKVQWRNLVNAINSRERLDWPTNYWLLKKYLIKRSSVVSPLVGKKKRCGAIIPKLITNTLDEVLWGSAVQKIVFCILIRCRPIS